MNNPFGQIRPPVAIQNLGTAEGGALGKILNLFLNLLIVGAGIYALINFILAGYAFMSAGDDPKKVQGAWGRIYQTVIGLLFTAGGFLLAAIFGKLIFGDYSALLRPSIPSL